MNDQRCADADAFASFSYFAHLRMDADVTLCVREWPDTDAFF